MATALLSGAGHDVPAPGVADLAGPNPFVDTRADRKPFAIPRGRKPQLRTPSRRVRGAGVRVLGASRGHASRRAENHVLFTWSVVTVALMEVTFTKDSGRRYLMTV